MGFGKITKHDDYLDIHIERLISHKSINLVEKQFHINYNHGTELKIYHSIDENLFNEKYIPKIEAMLRKRKYKNEITKKKKEKPIPQKNTASNNDYIEKEKRLYDKAVREARDNSFRRCENCDYFSSRQKRCGLFSRLVQPDNVCGRFHYTKYRVYLGGGFSPR